MTDYASARQNMVDGQLRPNAIVEPSVLRAFATIPREVFIPGNLRRSAYVDANIKLPDGRFLLEPLVMARMLQAAGLRLDDTVLNLGETTGYAAALLSDLVGSVATVEAPADAVAAWQSLRLGNLASVSAFAPGSYSFIFVGGAVVDVPVAWLDALGARGRILAVLQPPGKPGTVTLIEKDANGVAARLPLFNADIPYLPGHAPQPVFAF